jgi:hypothetical protein
MVFWPNTTASIFFRDALKQPDGIVAYAFVALSALGLVFAWIAPSPIAELSALSHVRENTLAIVFFPFLALGMYGQNVLWLSESRMQHWIYAVANVIVGGVCIWLATTK